VSCASPSCHRMHLSAVCTGQAHLPLVAGEQCGLHSCAGTLHWASTCPLKSALSFPWVDLYPHNILLRRLNVEFGITGTALSRLQSNQTQFIKLSRHASAPVSCMSGVPQGSILGPILFAVYISPISDFIDAFSIHTSLLTTLRSTNSSV